MKDRWLGAMIGLLCVLLTFGLARVPWGWGLATAVCAIGGWTLGGYIRHLRRLSERDELTGISNRRHFERALTRHWDRAVSEGNSLSLLFLDVDDFGALNKRFGHLMGDEALKAICRQIRQHVRTSDVVARWGGEEFVVLLPNTDTVQALVIAERIRSVIHQSPVRDRERSASVTISTGVAGYPGTARSASDLLRQAIQGQLVAKARKNTVEVVS